MFLPEIINVSAVTLDGGPATVSGGTVLFDGGDASISRAYPFFDGGIIGSIASHDNILVSMQKTNINLINILSSLSTLRARIDGLGE